MGSVGSNGGMSNDGGDISGLADMSGGDGFAGGDRDEVLNIGTVNLGDDVAMLNLNGDNLDGGVVHAVLGGDGAASVLHGSLNRVSDGGGNDGGGSNVSNGSGVSSGVGESTGKTVSVVSIGISLGGGIGFTLGNNVSGISEGSVTENVGGLLAERDILDLFSVDGDGVADVLSAGHAVLGGQDLVLGFAVGGGASVVGHGGDGANSIAIGGVSLGIGVGSSSGTGQEEGQDKNLHGRNCR
jgi:hypothetical protein